MAPESFDGWLDEHMRQGERNIPGRLSTFMALLERLRVQPTLQVHDHLTASHAQLIEHNDHVARALERHGVTGVVEEFGRRANNVGAWIEPFFRWLTSAGFPEMSSGERDLYLDGLGTVAGTRLRAISEDKPLVARFGTGTAVAIIKDILDQAQDKKRAKDVAEYLVGAKLQLRLGPDVVTPKNVNTARGPADFCVGTTAIEVTVNPPDSGHLDQLKSILCDTGLDVWLGVRSSLREKWDNVVDAAFESQHRNRVVVADLELFLGQNVSEIGKFEAALINETLVALFKRYNDVWLPGVGSSGLRIVSSAPDDA